MSGLTLWCPECSATLWHRKYKSLGLNNGNAYVCRCGHKRTREQMEIEDNNVSYRSAKVSKE